jgi:hypothetical protein
MLALPAITILMNQVVCMLMWKAEAGIWTLLKFWTENQHADRDISSV